MTYGIYLIINKKINQKYIGQSVDIERRIRDHNCGRGIKNSYIDKAIAKYGKQNFDYKIIEKLPNNQSFLVKSGVKK